MFVPTDSSTNAVQTHEWHCTIIYSQVASVNWTLVKLWRCTFFCGVTVMFTHSGASNNWQPNFPLCHTSQHLQGTIQALQDELRIQRDLNQLFQSDYSESGLLGSHGLPLQEMTEENFLRLHSEYERQVKELFLLRKTVEEMELRIDTQKHTLNARWRQRRTG